MTDGQRLVVAGGGPGGMAAAAQAARLGLAVTMVDEATTLGGQYYRGRQASQAAGSPRRFLAETHGVEILLGTAIVDAPEAGRLTLWSETGGARAVEYDALVLATGAYDRTVALPGWTLPGVLTAGGASTLIKAYGVSPGKRLIVAGSGPFLLSVADDLSSHGCQVLVIEATSYATSVGGVPVLARDLEIAQQTLGFLARLAVRGVRRRYGSMVTAIHGQGRVEAATVQRVDEAWRPIPGTETTVETDGVCLGFGFVPQLELAQALGCAVSYHDETSDFAVRTDAFMRTSQKGIYAAGEITGIGGARVARTEGQLAGLTAALDAGALSAAEHEAQAGPIQRRLRDMQRVAEWMRSAFRPRPGLWSLAQPDTLMCRCEDVSVATAAAALAHNPPTPYAVKTATRLGMGLCQGRICSPYLIEWLRAHHGYEAPLDERPWRIRPPLRPVRLGDWPAGEAA